jgi:hypothetical protein
MKEIHANDQKTLDATLHNTVTWANLHLGFQHIYTKMNEDSNVNGSGVSGTVAKCHKGMTPQKWLVHVHWDRR